MELCAVSLDQCYYDGRRQLAKYKGPIPPDYIALNQLASGLEYLHTMKLVHRDIRPEKVMICLRPRIRMVWSDFGASKALDTKIDGTIVASLSWLAPELTMNESHLTAGTTESDIFSAGCLFFYIVTKGHHPFGVKNVRDNILAGDATYFKTSRHIFAISKSNGI